MMIEQRYEKDVAITGIGQSEVARPSSKSAMRLTLDACLEAIADAGLERHDIDGVACWPGDNNNGDPFSPVGPSALKSALGPAVFPEFLPLVFGRYGVQGVAVGLQGGLGHLSGIQGLGSAGEEYKAGQ